MTSGDTFTNWFEKQIDKLTPAQLKWILKAMLAFAVSASSVLIFIGPMSEHFHDHGLSTSESWMWAVLAYVGLITVIVLFRKRKQASRWVDDTFDLNDL